MAVSAILAWSVLIPLLGAGRAMASVTLSEVMYDPLGSEYHDEFVELANTSDTAWVDLGGWQLGDAEELDELVHGGGGTLLGPGQFALVLDGSYATHSTTYDSLRDVALMLTIDDRAFGAGGWSNSSPETILLVNAQGDTVDVFVCDPQSQPGRSWEKIDLTAGSGAQNWALSLAPGGTPGSASRFIPGGPVASLELSPDPFADRLEIEYRLPASPALVSLRIYDLQGRRIRTLLHSADSGPRGEVVWNGADDGGGVVLPGLYIVYLEASAGGHVWRVKQAVARRSQSW